MSHPDPDQLALIALGEPVATDADRAHLAACPDCAADVAEMTHTARVARTTIDDAELESPPSGVWDRIHNELHLPIHLAVDPLATATTPRRDLDAPDRDAPELAHAPARRKRHRRPSRIGWAIAASAALVVGIGAATWVAVTSAKAPDIIASATLDPFPAHPEATGTAAVSEDRDGARTLTVTFDDVDQSDDYREVWMIRNDGEALVSLGILNKPTETFPLPSGIDLAEYDLVDVSVEPLDGDPSHSGDSIARGRLGL